ncbi:NAD-dependent deacylase [Bacillus sp. RAR_GA_16]|uniref:NAD-dependent deacylase n=1 Tax=Bacillus sp. RAR_GA_16 TaxID=2876774 RepID=UPI001CCC3CFC|nr:NAD-dependent deacylase [Bacillus sp. RAR_GA_16]MCA0172474.1 NAD-dependent deacylase [Bacillus sp. RAR_GA_16]
MLTELFKRSSHTVVLTGAGMSTESGLPDFRSALDGMWNEVDPLQLASRDAMQYERNMFVRFYKQRIKKLREFSPHQGYYHLAEWERNGKVGSILTQNVDGFHQLAGSQNVAEMHGSLRMMYCDDCGEKASSDAYLNDDLICECGGFNRPGVVLFGEPLPLNAIHRAKIEAKKADLFIVLGSSLQVAPANVFPIEAKRNGAKLVIVNEEETGYDKVADLVIREKIGKVLNDLAEAKAF